VDIVLATTADMPKPDPESHLLVDALARLGLTAELRPWDEDRDWAEVPLVVSRTPWDYFLRYDDFVAWVRRVAAATRLENPPEVILWNAHKSYLLDLERTGIPVVATELVEHGAGESAQARAFAGYDEVVVKPAVSGGALDTIRGRAGDSAARDHLSELAARGDVLVQPFLPEILESGETSLIFFDGGFSHAVRKIPTAGEYRVQEEFGGAVVEHDPTPAEFAIAEAVLAASPAPTSYARIDLVELDFGPAVMEAELIEPELFLPTHPAAAARFAAVLARRLI
jgi:glutathione synthase/RimK-type ligase-like ATP-grasp enzyme